MADRTKCSICGKTPVSARGWCRGHYRRWRLYGDPLGVPGPTPEERFWPKVDKNGPVPVARPDLGPCWLWTACTERFGYGNFSVDGRLRPAHRWAWENAHGPVPDGLEMDHLCKVPACVNPGHLEPVTHRENMMRSEAVSAIAARKTHCAQGHEFTPENTYWRTGGRHRSCKRCTRERDARKYRCAPEPEGEGDA